MAQRLPPHAWFLVSAVFHYLGPAFAVLLFAKIGILGVAWLRIASAALIFAPATRPWRHFAAADRSTATLLLAFGVCLAAMNCCFYLALATLPLSLVAAIEFVGPVGLALYGMRSPRNLAALLLTVLGAFVLINLRWASDPAGLAFAAANAMLFVLYIVLGHRLAANGAASGIAGLGAAMAVAALLVLPFGIGEAAMAFASPMLLLAGAGVGLCSSVIPYVCDQLAMARLPRASFALMLSLLPATATLIGALVLGQWPAAHDLSGILLVIAGIGLHRPAASR